MIPNLKHVKLLRANANANTILLWFGGNQILEYQLNKNQETGRYEINGQKENYPSYREVKNRMREIIKGGEDGYKHHYSNIQ